MINENIREREIKTAETKYTRPKTVCVQMKKDISSNK